MGVGDCSFEVSTEKIPVKGSIVINIASVFKLYEMPLIGQLFSSEVVGVTSIVGKIPPTSPV